MSGATESTSTSNGQEPIVIPPLTVEEEDQIILARITNEERPLRRVIKKFHNYTAVSHTPVVPPLGSSAPDNASNNAPNLIDDAREAFLVELASFQLSLQKSAMICEAEARQVEEYQRERQRIEDEHGTLRGQIEQLKTSLEHAQMVRRRKIEYDLFAEKVNTLPSREELETSIQALENDMAAIRSEHETQNRTIQGQKHALDSIISDLGSLRFIGKDREVAASAVPSTRATPALENSTTDDQENAAEGGSTLPVTEDEREEGEEDKPLESALEGGRVGEDDIEMGEVEEDVKEVKVKKKAREDLEEGEATDASSELSEPPDDI